MRNYHTTTERLDAMNRHMHRFGIGAAAVITVLAVSACDFEVVNPGPIRDDFLDSLPGHASLVNGMRRSLNDAMDWIIYWGAAMTFEMNPAGSTGSFGIPANVQNGQMDPDDGDGRWNDAQEARWVAEDGLRRFARVLDPAVYDASVLVARAYLWAGYSNRLLGENFCDAVFDGGSMEPHTNFLTRAEQHFTDAIRVGGAAGGTSGTEVVNAATAGRASVRVSLATFNGNNAATWAAAAADAGAIASNTYLYQMPFSNQDLNQYNHIMWAGSSTAVTQGSPYRAHTTWGTYYEDYFTQNPNDTRVQFVIARNAVGALLRGDANVGRFGTNCTKTIGTQALCSSNLRVPFLPQAKFTSQSSPMNLSSGWEMRLIQAEEALVRLGAAGVPTAVGFMNQRRSNLGLTDIPVTSTLDEAWTALKAERAFEMWIEGRRLGDLRRWTAAGSPGTTHDGAYFLDGSGTLVRTETMATRQLCFPIGRGELETNPNLVP